MAPEAPSQVGAGAAFKGDERLEVEKGVVAIECLCKDFQVKAITQIQVDISCALPVSSRV
jgi:hypothetical protein